MRVEFVLEWWIRKGILVEWKVWTWVERWATFELWLSIVMVTGGRAVGASGKGEKLIWCDYAIGF